MPVQPAVPSDKSVTSPLATSGVSVDRLSALLAHFSVRTHLFHAGALCGATHFDAHPGRAFLHVLRRGEMVVTHQPRSGAPRRIAVTEPSLLFYPRPLAHVFYNAPSEDSDFVCATVDFEGGPRHPVVVAMPPVLVLPLSAVSGLGPTLELLFAETERLRCGQRLMADRLFEVLLLQLLRWLLDHPEESGQPVGLLHGLAHPKLARALTAVHESPGAAWSLEAMAATAGMSRSAFATAFKHRLGSAPAEYLLRWRVSLAMGMLLAGATVQRASDRLGYASAASFSRAFTQTAGVSPRAWLQARSGAAGMTV